MRLSQLTVRQFRNLASLDLEIPEPGVVIIGENGQGTTNFLEAIYYLVLFRSLRGAKDRELVRFGEPGFFVAAVAGAHRVTAGYETATRRKKVTLDGSEVSKLSEAVGTLLAVPFSPADVSLVGGGPSARRRYLDVVLSVSEPPYLGRLTELKTALKQRNAALRRGRPEEARAFDGPFARAAEYVTATRRRWVERWHERFGELCRALGEPSAAGLRYRTGEGTDGTEGTDDADAWCRRLGARMERDLRQGVTTVGPHRDDLRLSLAGRDLRIYGSAGQQRTAAIALRVIEAETLAATRGAAPIALYDDVFAELDENRQARLLELIREALPGQAIVAAPRDSEVPAALFDRPRWQVAGGRLDG
ncbi:MAG: DNA replication/repair protein RecF [Gemmatimonadetes bacterium]|nr:DNA replication/repair protein RecF [Gemmatimonadota bacterium]